MLAALSQWVAGSALAQGLSRTREALPTELFAGVEKPSVTLAKMLAAEMLQNLDASKSKVTSSYSSTGVSFAFPSFTFVHERSPSGATEVYRVLLKTGGDLKGDDEFRIIKEAFNKFTELRKRKASLVAEEKRQQAAIDAIEALFKPKETPCASSPPPTSTSPKQPSSPATEMVESLLCPTSSVSPPFEVPNTSALM